jgi:hypothetical protein
VQQDFEEGAPMHDESELARHNAEVAALEAQSATAARLFDVRTVIGGLFVVYGVLIGSAGIFATDKDMAKALGININLWTGLAMFVLGLLFLLWMRLRPLIHPTTDTPSTDT